MTKKHNRGKNPILATFSRSVPYVPALRGIAGSVTAALLLQQLDYLWYSAPEEELEQWGGVVVFAEPADSNRHYRLGRSISEMLAFTEDERRTAFGRIGVAYNTYEQLERVMAAGEDPFAGKFWLSWRNRKEGVTIYMRNSPLLDRVLNEFATTLDPQIHRESQYKKTTRPPRVDQILAVTNMANPDQREEQGHGDTPSGYGDTPFTQTEYPDMGKPGFPTWVNRDLRHGHVGNPDMVHLESRHAPPCDGEPVENARNPGWARVSGVEPEAIRGAGHINARARARLTTTTKREILERDIERDRNKRDQERAREDLNHTHTHTHTPPIPPTPPQGDTQAGREQPVIVGSEVQRGSEGQSVEAGIEQISLSLPELKPESKPELTPESEPAEPALTGLPAYAGRMREKMKKRDAEIRENLARIGFEPLGQLVSTPPESGQLLPLVSKPPSKIAYKPCQTPLNDSYYLNDSQQGFKGHLTPKSVNVQLAPTSLDQTQQVSPPENPPRSPLTPQVAPPPPLSSSPPAANSKRRGRAGTGWSRDFAQALVREYNTNRPDGWAQVQRLTVERERSLQKLWEACENSLEVALQNLRYACWQLSVDLWWVQTAAERKLRGDSPFGLETLLAKGKVIPLAEKWAEKQGDKRDQRPDPSEVLGEKLRQVHAKLQQQQQAIEDSIPPAEWTDEKRYCYLMLYARCKSYQGAIACLEALYFDKAECARYKRQFSAWFDWAYQAAERGDYPQLYEPHTDPLYNKVQLPKGW